MQNETALNETPVHIRWMIKRDLPEVIDIENHAFEFPWSEDDFIDRLRKRNVIGMVAENDDDISGFMVYELKKESLYLINFAVHPDDRRAGVGRQMIRKIIGKLSPARRKTISLEVRETNFAAQMFFRANGFRCNATIRDRYDDTTEDAYIFVYDVDEPAAIITTKNRIKGQILE